MNKTKAFFLAVLVSLFAPINVATSLGGISGDAPDQGHIDWGSLSSGFHLFLYYGQSFQPSQNNVSKIELPLYRTGDADNLTIWICKTYGGGAPSEWNATTEVDASSIQEDFPFVWVNITFNPVVNVIASQEYWIVAYSGDNNTDHLTWAYKNVDTYPLGQILGGASQDFVFRTYYDDFSVPEVTNPLLLLIGSFLVLSVVVLRKRNSSLKRAR